MLQFTGLAMIPGLPGVGQMWQLEFLRHFNPDRARNSNLAAESFIVTQSTLPPILFLGRGDGREICHSIPDDELAGRTSAFTATRLHPIDAILLKMRKHRFGQVVHFNLFSSEIFYYYLYHGRATKADYKRFTIKS